MCLIPITAFPCLGGTSLLLITWGGGRERENGTIRGTEVVTINPTQGGESVHMIPLPFRDTDMWMCIQTQSFFSLLGLVRPYFFSTHKHSTLLPPSACTCDNLLCSQKVHIHTYQGVLCLHLECQYHFIYLLLCARQSFLSLSDFLKVHWFFPQTSYSL